MSLKIRCSTCTHILPFNEFKGKTPNKVFKVCESCRLKCRNLMRVKAEEKDVVPQFRETCVCGVSYLESRKEHHFKGLKHRKFMESLKEKGQEEKENDDGDEFLLIIDEDNTFSEEPEIVDEIEEL